MWKDLFQDRQDQSKIYELQPCLKSIMSTLSNTRPITLSSSSTNTRGRVYRCLKCDVNPYEGERSKVMLHFYRKHVAQDMVPFYCNICKFITTSQNELEKHVNPKNYPAHLATVQAMSSNGEEVNEADSLLQNLKHYIITDTDIQRLEKAESQKIFLDRKRKHIDILASAAQMSNLPILDLQDDDLFNTIPSPSISVLLDEDPIPEVTSKKAKLPHHHPTPQLPISLQQPLTKTTNTTAYQLSKENQPLPTQKNIAHTQPSPSSSSSSSSSSSTTTECTECTKTASEIKLMKKDIRTMALAMHQMIEDMKEMKDTLLKQQNQQQVSTLQQQNEKEETKENQQRWGNNNHRQREQHNNNYRYNRGYRRTDDRYRNTHYRF